uniref:Uncharacterized protein n=1 Tax=Rhizophora mucronata TaxID=61149 RepID=A0A2P2QGG7_RHIMU
MLSFGCEASKKLKICSLKVCKETRLYSVLRSTPQRSMH